jgi:hypothetical protein
MSTDDPLLENPGELSATATDETVAATVALAQRRGDELTTGVVSSIAHEHVMNAARKSLLCR